MKLKNYREIIVDYLGSVCNSCGSNKDLQLHHIVPTRCGGYNTMSNIELLCSICHHKIHIQVDKILGNDEMKIHKCSDCGKDFVSSNRGKSTICIKCRVKGVSNGNRNICQIRALHEKLFKFLRESPESIIMYDD